MIVALQTKRTSVTSHFHKITPSLTFLDFQTAKSISCREMPVISDKQNKKLFNIALLEVGSLVSYSDEIMSSIRAWIGFAPAGGREDNLVLGCYPLRFLSKGRGKTDRPPPSIQGPIVSRILIKGRKILWKLKRVCRRIRICRITSTLWRWI